MVDDSFVLDDHVLELVFVVEGGVVDFQHFAHFFFHRINKYKLLLSDVGMKRGRLYKQSRYLKQWREYVWGYG